MAYSYPQFYKPRPVVNPAARLPQPGQMTDEQIQQLVQQALKQQASQGGGGMGAGEVAGSGGAGAGASQLISSGSAPAFTTAGENAAWNAAGMEASGAPMTLAEAGGAPAAEAGSGLGMVLPAVGVAIGTYLTGKGLNDLRKGRKDNSTKGKLARAQTASVTGGYSEVARGVMGGKGKDQKGRDANRKALQEKGLYDKDFNLQLSDGTLVNMGRDGSKGQYNVDFGQEGIGDIVASVDPLAAIVSGGDKKRRNDLAGELTNAIKGSKDPRAEARALYAKYGIDAKQANELLGAVGGSDTAAFQNSVNNLFSGQVSRPRSAPTPIPRAPMGNNGGLQNDGTMLLQPNDKIRVNDPGFNIMSPIKTSSMGGQKGMSAFQMNPQIKDKMYLVGRDGPALPGMEAMIPKIPDVMTQTRSSTRSPGIDKNGNRINYGRR